MNGKKLLIAFVSVSVAALAVSGFAVFSVARAYSFGRSGNTEDAENNEKEEKTEAAPSQSETENRLETSPEPETEAATEAAAGTEPESPEETAKEIESAPEGFTLKFSGGGLIIISPEGEKVYERIIDEGDLKSKDLELLREGLDFPDIESAMSAVYDLIS